MACTFDLNINDCFLEIVEQPSNEIKYQFALGGLTFTQINDTQVSIRDTAGNRFTDSIDAINGYADISTLFTFLDASRDACAPATGGGGTPIVPVEVTGTYTHIISTGIGATTADILGVEVTNTGGSNGTWAGATLIPGQTKFVNKEYNEATGEVVLIPAIAYDASGTTFSITEFSS